ncbi:hypothetical protein XELAEV_18010381mg [Xenopus laevis]|uniref:RRM domain-containing protein n=1 Tax=Xenopus laevis TaxID=8355 RepID=A0A974DWB4_XENLA|nr:hypothetical protein XELAEV_18010381mg [Xenopus laevis]
MTKCPSALTNYQYRLYLSSEEEVQKALKRKKDYMDGRYIEVFRDNYTKCPSVTSKAQSRPWEQCDKPELQQDYVSESDRLFVRNLPYSCTEDDLEKLFSKCPISEIHLPIDSLTKKPLMLHVLSSAAKKEEVNESEGEASGYKKQKAIKDKAVSSSSHNWNTLFMGTSSVAEVIAQKYNTSKSQVLDDEGKGSLAVRVALGETQLVRCCRSTELNGDPGKEPSSWTAELQELFGQFGDLERVLLPEGGISAIVEFLEPTEAKHAFYKLAYTKKVEQTEQVTSEEQEEDSTKQDVKELEVEEQEEDEEEALPDHEREDCMIVIVKSQSLIIYRLWENLSMGSNPWQPIRYLHSWFSLQLSEKAQEALWLLQHCTVDEHQGEIKLSERAISSKKQISKKQQSSKILVRNVPFQATVREIRELFSTFGELKTVRLPKKMVGTGTRCGFGFVDFVTKQDAKKKKKVSDLIYNFMESLDKDNEDE